MNINEEKSFINELWNGVDYQYEDEEPAVKMDIVIQETKNMEWRQSPWKKNGKDEEAAN